MIYIGKCSISKKTLEMIGIIFKERQILDLVIDGRVRLEIEDNGAPLEINLYPWNSEIKYSWDKSIDKPCRFINATSFSLDMMIERFKILVEIDNKYETFECYYNGDNVAEYGHIISHSVEDHLRKGFKKSIYEAIQEFERIITRIRAKEITEEIIEEISDVFTIKTRR